MATESKSKQFISKEVAEKWFNDWLEAMDIDLDFDRMDEDDKAGAINSKNKIIRAIERGHLIFNDNGEAVYTPHRPNTKQKEPITFHERTGASLLSQDGVKKNSDMKKTFRVMGDMCKVSPVTFANMVGSDLSVCQAIFVLLMD